MEKTPWEVNWRKTQKEPIAHSGQAFAYIVEDKRDPGRQGVLKRLKRNEDAQARGRMKTEVSSLEVLAEAKAAVPRVFEHNTNEFNDPSTVLYLVMEYIPGSTLAAIVENQRLSIEKAAAIVCKLAEVTAEAFKQNILHRDLKPDNIIVRDIAANDVVVIDYGLSFNEKLNTDGTITRDSETFRNRFLDLPETNTPGGDMRDKRSDITALCAILYYCLTGHRPGHLQDSAGRLPHRRQGYSIAESLKGDPRIRQLEMLFDVGLHPQIDVRFRTLEEFLTRLSAAINSDASGEPDDPIEIARQSSKRVRANDRKTQLAEFVPTCTKVITAITKYVQETHQEYAKQRYSLVTTTQHARKPLPGDTVPGVEVTLQINLNGHGIIRSVTYAAGSKGEQCVLMRRDTGRDTDSGAIGELRNWTEVYWFEGVGEPATDQAVKDLKRWLGQAIHEIESLVLR